MSKASRVLAPLTLAALAALAGCADDETPVEPAPVAPEAEVVTEPADDVVVDSTLLEPGPALEDDEERVDEGTVGEP